MTTPSTPEPDLPGQMAFGTLDPPKRTDLVARFGVPPFSVLDTRQGYWRKRRDEWLDFGIHSELGRDPALPSPSSAWLGGISIFDPVLCESMYRWYSPPGGTVLDPFAGGSVRGITAAVLGRHYEGIDLSGEQVEANREQAVTILDERHPVPTWHEADSLVWLQDRDLEPYDFVFTCPPYFDLEVYSNDPRDLSAMSWEGFDKAYYTIMKASFEALADNRFGAVVVSNVRSKVHHGYLDLAAHTKAAAQAGGARLYNEHVLVNAVGSLPVRITRQFNAGRKAGRMHQDVLVFLKGDHRLASEACGDPEAS